MYYCSHISFQRQCTAAGGIENLTIVKETLHLKGVDFHVFECCDTNPVFQVKLVFTATDFIKGPPPQQNGVGVPLAKLDKWCHPPVLWP